METLLREQISELRATVVQLREELGRDQLTGLMNLRALELHGNGRLGWYIFADLDGFGGAQNAHPEHHTYGNRVLCSFASFLLNNTRQLGRVGEKGTVDSADAIAYRVGGDEFAVWCPNKLGALRIQAKLRHWVSDQGDVKCSAGLALTLAGADAAMYRNKQMRKLDAS